MHVCRQVLRTKRGREPPNTRKYRIINILFYTFETKIGVWNDVFSPSAFSTATSIQAKNNNIRIPDLSRISGNAKNKRFKKKKTHTHTAWRLYVVSFGFRDKQKEKSRLSDFVVTVNDAKFQTCNHHAHPQHCFHEYYFHEYLLCSAVDLRFKNFLKPSQVKKWLPITQHIKQLWFGSRRKFETKSGQRRWSKETKSYRATRWLASTACIKTHGF